MGAVFRLNELLVVCATDEKEVLWTFDKEGCSAAGYIFQKYGFETLFHRLLSMEAGLLIHAAFRHG